MNPIDVQIVRPTKTAAQNLTTLFTVCFAYATNGYLLMLILGAISPWHLSYWHSVLAIVGARCLVSSSDSSYLIWTRALGR